MRTYKSIGPSDSHLTANVDATPVVLAIEAMADQIMHLTEAARAYRPQVTVEVPDFDIPPPVVNVAPQAPVIDVHVPKQVLPAPVIEVTAGETHVTLQLPQWVSAAAVTFGVLQTSFFVLMSYVFLRGF